MGRVYKSVELLPEIAEKFGQFLKANGVYYEASGCYNLIHFEVLVNEAETEVVNMWLEEE